MPDCVNLDLFITFDRSKNARHIVTVYSRPSASEQWP